MRIWPWLFIATGVAIVLLAPTLFLFSGAKAHAGEDRAPRIEVDLSESFYRALRDEGSTTYSTNKSEDYLRQIAVSSRFAVESNLRIIKQQERIIELLEAIKNRKP